MPSEQRNEKLLLSQPAGRNFTLILNDALTDKRLSWRAKGILAGCLSLSGIKFSKQWIIDNGIEQRDAVIAALKELRKLGYLQNKTDRCDKTGHILGEYYVISDVPISSISADEYHQRTEKPDAGKPGRRLIHTPVPEHSKNEQIPVSDRVSEKGLTGVGKLPAYCVGAGNTGSQGSQNEVEASEGSFGKATTSQGCFPDFLPMSTGDGVGKECEETPRKGKELLSLQFPKSLEKHKVKIVEFWKGKRGAKTMRAWKMQMTELEKLKVKYGDEALEEQLNAAILAGSWHGIRVINYERYGVDKSKKNGVNINMNIHPSYRPLSYE